MAQWNPRSLTILICVSTAFLFTFNYFASFIGPLKYSQSFNPTPNGFSLNLNHLKLMHFPISIVGYSENQTAQFKATIFCGSKPIMNSKSISLISPYQIGFLQYNSNYKIFIEPAIPNTALFLELRDPILNIIIQILRFTFIFILFVIFFILFKNGKNFSVLRSVLIIQMMIIFMVDPFTFIGMCFPSLNFISYFIFSFAWYRCAIEVFNEYSVLVRHNSLIFKILLSIPFFCQIVLYLVKGYDPAHLIKYLFVLISTLAGFNIIALGCYFIMKVGKTTGRSSLIIHITTSVLVLSMVYFISIMEYAYNHELSFSFTGSFLCQTLQISFLGIFGLFQTVFQVGENEANSDSYIPRQLTQRKVGKKYEKIEELLESLESMNDTVKFDMTES